MKPLLPLLASLLALAAGGEASAHAQLVRADPRVGAVLSAPPARIWLKFNEVVRLPASGVMLISPGGGSAVLAPLTHDPADPRAIIAPAPKDLGPGAYQVKWRALSPDGHRTQGDFTFTVGGPGKR